MAASSTDENADDDGVIDRDARLRLAIGAFLVAGLVGLVLEATVLPAEGIPFGVQSLFIAVGAAAGMWLVGGEL